MFPWLDPFSRNRLLGSFHPKAKAAPMPRFLVACLAQIA